jgi:type II secretory pathway pseudopilin PulG
MKSIKCSECGFVGWADADRCKKCGVIRLANPDSNPATNTNQLWSQQSYQPYQGYAAGELKKGLATASMVVGIINLCVTGIFLVPSIVGIVMAVVAKKRIKNEPDVYGGDGFATAGLVTNIISTVLIVPLMIIMAIAIPNLLASRRAANEGASMAILRTIHSAEATYQATTGRGSYGTLDQLADAQLINPEFAAKAGTGRYGYKFKLEIGSAYTSLREDTELPGFHLVAVPMDYGNSGTRSFYIDETGVIRGEDTHGAEATALTPAVDNSSYSATSPRSRGYDSRGGY